MFIKDKYGKRVRIEPKTNKKKFRCYFKRFDKVLEGRIYCDSTSKFYLCQDTICGSRAPHTFEYKHSWVIINTNIDDLTDFELISEIVLNNLED